MAKAAAECEEAFLKTQVGKTVTVLFETYKDGVLDGYTENYTRVKMSSGKDLSGRLVPVTLTEALKDFCLAQEVE